MVRRLAVVFGVTVIGWLSGCGAGKQPWEVAHPASGALTFGGQPISGAQVTLFPTDNQVPESIRPTGVTDADGRFSLTTFASGDGAPAGEYQVSVIWHPVVDGEGGAVRGGNQLPPKFAVPTSSGLTVKVEPGGSTFPAIDIPKP